MIRKHGRWTLVRVKEVFTHPGLNDVFLVFHDLDLKFEVYLAKPFYSPSWKGLQNCIGPYFSYKGAETAGTCPINNSNQNPFVFPPSCQE